MITFIIILIGIIISGSILWSNKEKLKTKEGAGAWVSASVIFSAFLIGSFVQPYRIERVNAGCVGIQVKLAGSDRGVTDYKYKTGWVVYNSWTTQVVEIPTTIQHIEYKEQPVTTKGGFPTVINPTFNYTVKAATAGDMYVNLRKPLRELEEGWIKTAIVGAANDIANKWTIDSIFNNLGLFELTIKAECNSRLDRWFAIDQLRINIVPPDALKKAIADKTTSIQNVQVAENNKKVVIAEGQNRIAKARADSTVAMINATTDAAVIRTKQQQLTSLYIEWIKVTKWNGQLPTTVLGNSNGVMLNLGN